MSSEAQGGGTDEEGRGSVPRRRELAPGPPLGTPPAFSPPVCRTPSLPEQKATFCGTISQRPAAGRLGRGGGYRAGPPGKLSGQTRYDRVAHRNLYSFLNQCHPNKLLFLAFLTSKRAHVVLPHVGVHVTSTVRREDHALPLLTKMRCLCKGGSAPRLPGLFCVCFVPVPYCLH